MEKGGEGTHIRLVIHHRLDKRPALIRQSPDDIRTAMQHRSGAARLVCSGRVPLFAVPRELDGLLNKGVWRHLGYAVSLVVTSQWTNTLVLRVLFPSLSVSPSAPSLQDIPSPIAVTFYGRPLLSSPPLLSSCYHL